MSWTYFKIICRTNIESVGRTLRNKKVKDILVLFKMKMGKYLKKNLIKREGKFPKLFSF